MTTATTAPAAAPAPQPSPDRYRALVNALWNDKDFGATLRKRAKELFPDVTTPEDAVDPVVEPVRGELAALRETVEKLSTSLAERDQKAEEERVAKGMQEQIASARDKYNLTDKGFADMVERMKATGNYYDAEAAAAWAAGQQPPKVEPGPSWEPQHLDFFGSHEADDNFKLLHKDPDAYQDRVIGEFMKDPDKFVRETFAA